MIASSFAIGAVASLAAISTSCSATSTIITLSSKQEIDDWLTKTDEIAKVDSATDIISTEKEAISFLNKNVKMLHILRAQAVLFRDIVEQDSPFKFEYNEAKNTYRIYSKVNYMDVWTDYTFITTNGKIDFSKFVTNNNVGMGVTADFTTYTQEITDKFKSTFSFNYHVVGGNDIYFSTLTRDFPNVSTLTTKIFNKKEDVIEWLKTTENAAYNEVRATITPGKDNVTFVNNNVKMLNLVRAAAYSLTTSTEEFQTMYFEYNELKMEWAMENENEEQAPQDIFKYGRTADGKSDFSIIKYSTATETEKTATFSKIDDITDTKYIGFYYEPDISMPLSGILKDDFPNVKFVAPTK